MITNVKELRGYRIHTTDGDIGKVSEFYFDDNLWSIRYLVVDTGGWLPDRQVLISSAVLEHPDRDKKLFPVSLTKEQVKSSPPTNTDKPLYRQHEHELHDHYGWPVYWEPGPLSGEIAIAQSEYMADEYDKDKKGDPHLRSTKIVDGYHVQATDGRIGHIDDFILDDEKWTVKYIVVDTRDWLPGKKVLIPLKWIKDLNWAERKAYINLPLETIKNSPKFDHSVPLNEEYENKLNDYYEQNSGTKV
jgi:sporulation protein YlmC with PRC-barrel domain